MNTGLALLVILLFFLCFIAVRILQFLSSISREMATNSLNLNAIHNYLADFHDRADRVIDTISEIEIHLSLVKDEIHEIKRVTDIIRDYKLPDESERKVLDKIEAERGPHD
jgi:hypothetical protein